MRTCTRCSLSQALDEFYFRKGRGDQIRRETVCRTCKRTIAREWARANPERNRARATAWNRANRERSNASMLRSWHRRRSVPFTDAGWEYATRVLAYDPCSYCVAPAVEVDHIKPVAGGGDGDWTNLTAACRSCNAQKHRKSLLSFLMEATCRTG